MKNIPANKYLILDVATKIKWGTRKRVSFQERECDPGISRLIP